MASKINTRIDIKATPLTCCKQRKNRHKDKIPRRLSKSSGNRLNISDANSHLFLILSRLKPAQYLSLSLLVPCA